MASRTVYCICGEPYDAVRFMIQCESCKDWYHGSCVNVKEHEATDIEKYHCVQCQNLVGPSVYREVKNLHRHDYGDSNADGKAVQSGTPVFVKELRSRHFKSAEDVIIRLRGPQLSLPYLIQNGFSYPILVDSTMGLGIQMPSDSFTVSDVMDYVGPGFELDVIDVAKQGNFHMPMSEWVDYFNNPVRNKVYNVISLEFSKTRLSELVKPPAIVQKLSWVENYWPKNSETHTKFCPQVMKYCLMSAQDSYTDFHIDFGGTSVWYHILRGEKIFFLIQPTPANLALYEHWMVSSNQSETFFGDQVDVCYQMTLTQGQTLFIPTGWIHAVLTPDDSLVFGGNFLHSLNIPLQLHIHEMEKRINTPEKFRFPTFETIHWFSAPHILDQLKDNNVSKRELNFLVTGAKALVSVLKIWSSDSQNHKHDDVPPGINVTKLIKDLMKEVRVAEKYASSKNPTVIARKPPPRQKRKEVIKRIEKPVKVGPTESEKNLSLVSQFSLKSKLQSNPELFYDDFNFQAQGSDMQLNLQESKMMLDKMNIDIKTLLGSSLKEGIMARNLSVPFGIACKEENFSIKKDSVYDFVDSDDDNLVVDENPASGRKQKDAKREVFTPDGGPEMQQGALRLRLSFNGKPIDGNFNPNSLLSNPPQDDSNAETPKNATIDDLLVATGLAADGESSVSLDDDALNNGQAQLEPSTRDAIQGMLSMSKGAIRFSSQGSQSGLPIQSMQGSQKAENCLPELSLPHMDSSLANLSILARKSNPQVRSAKITLGLSRFSNSHNSEVVDDFEEQLKQCHQEGDYIYLGLEGSDDECHVFKPRGRSRRDEPWNPKAKLVPNCPKPERPVREGTRKEAIECGLAAAAAKLATMPPQKRQYMKKKPISRSKLEQQHMSLNQAGPSNVVFNSNKRQLPSEPSKVNKRPKKGFATAKQRLGKILKIHKMLY